jgi:hypothetical protein
MSFQTDPPLMSLNKVDVMELNPHLKSIVMIVQVTGEDMDKMNHDAKLKVARVMEYLVHEGFIDNKGGWNINVTTVQSDSNGF